MTKVLFTMKEDDMKKLLSESLLDKSKQKEIVLNSDEIEGRFKKIVYIMKCVEEYSDKSPKKLSRYMQLMKKELERFSKYLAKIGVSCPWDHETLFEDGPDLIEASIHNDAARIKELLKQGANPDQVDDREHVTALQYAAKHNSFAAAKALLEGGANVEVADVEGNCPLTIAFSEGDKRMIRLLAGMDKEEE